MPFLRTLYDALRLCVGWRPSRSFRDIGPGTFWCMLLLDLAAVTAQGFWLTHAPRGFSADGLAPLAFDALLSLLLAYGFAVAVRRPVLFWPLATLLLALQTIIASVLYVLAEAVGAWRGEALSEHSQTLVDAAWWLWFGFATWTALGWLHPLGKPLARVAAALVLASAALAAIVTLPAHDLIVAGTAPAIAADDGDATTADATPAKPAIRAEAVLDRQRDLVDAAVRNLDAQVPGKVDVYVVAFAGDADEDVFSNEVHYVERLYRERFGLAGHIIVLANNTATVDTTPLASVSNLRRALNGVGSRMDPDEDLLLLYVSSHGSREGEIYVNLPPLPLDQLDARSLKSLLDGSGIRDRVVMLSACYSGTFIPFINDSHTLALTAARADRSSFGCGNTDAITWFGRALLVDALNREPRLLPAFEDAKAEISRWEDRDEQQHSFPQLARAPDAEAKLDLWESQRKVGPAVPFEPADGTTAAPTVGGVAPSGDDTTDGDDPDDPDAPTEEDDDGVRSAALAPHSATVCR